MAASGWFEAIWEYRYLEIYISMAGMALALWMGLYILRRGAGTPVGLLSGATLLLLSIAYSLEAILDAPGITVYEYEMLLRTQGLVVPSPIAIWVGLALLIRSEKRITTTVKWVWLIVGTIGASQVWLRAFTNWHYDYAHIVPSTYPCQDWWQPPGQGYAASTVLALAALVWSSYSIFRPFYDEAGSVRAILRVRQFWPLFSGISLFAISIGCMMAVYALGVDAPGVIGLGGVTVGVVALGFGVCWHNTFVEEGRDITTDFLYSISGIGAVLALYALIVSLLDGFDRWGVGPVVVMVAALVITHSLRDVACPLFDRLLDRVGLSRWTMSHRLRRQVLLRAQCEEESRDAPRQRLDPLLEQLCLDVATNRGYVALRDTNGFIVQAAYGTPPPTSRLTSPELVCESMAPVQFDHHSDELKGTGMIVPLKMQGRQVGVLVLGEKRYDIGEISRMLVHAEAMELAIEEMELAKEIRRLQRRLERVQRHKQPGPVSEDDRKLLAICASSGTSFSSAGDAITAANGTLENYSEDPYALEASPFMQCTRIQSQLSRIRDRSQAPIHCSDWNVSGQAVAILELEIAATVAWMKPAHQHSYDWQQWTYLDRRYIHRHDDSGHRFTMEDIARAAGVSRKTLGRRHQRAIRDFILAFLDPARPSSAL